MAISLMAKAMIVTHRSEISELMEALQKAGIMEVLNAERALVTKDWPELMVDMKRPRHIEDLVARLEKAIKFLELSSPSKGGLMSALRPLNEISTLQYASIVSGDEALKLLEKTESVASEIESLNRERETVIGRLEMLAPWATLTVPVEELDGFEKAFSNAGLIPEKNFEQAASELSKLGGTLEVVASAGRFIACIVIGLKENAPEINKKMRALDFESVSFESMTGTPAGLIADRESKLMEIDSTLAQLRQKAQIFAENKLQLKIIYDHYNNLANREHMKTSVPATESTYIIEGWVRQKQYKQLEMIVNSFPASNVSTISPGKEEETPVDIENSAAVRPFETITRLYGMPSIKDVDPTVFLAPFFAIFFGLCLTDAAYGLILAGLMWWLIRKFQGDNKAFKMFLYAAIATVIAGVITGSFFGDAIQSLIPQDNAFGQTMNNLRLKLMLFDPMQQPMIFFLLSIALGYLQIQLGLFISFFNHLRNRDLASAIFNSLTWILLLNSLVVLGLSKANMFPAVLVPFMGWTAIAMAVLIFFFTERTAGMGGRVGGGIFALFSTVFYFGDVLSYVRLMALGMVSSGLGMAVNIIVALVMDLPYGIGFILGALIFVGGHSFNLAMSCLSSFVHSLRLQFVEFFPKFLAGGGKDFKPLQRSFQHVQVNSEE